MLDLNPINERLNKATPGPWKHGCNRYGWSVFTDARPVLLIGDLWTKNGQDPSWALNADLIANAPTDLRAMIDEIERLRILNQRCYEFARDIATKKEGWAAQRALSLCAEIDESNQG